MSDSVFVGCGQINMTGNFGKLVCHIAGMNDVKTIFEVGSWNGQGSTVCLMNGAIQNPGAIVYSLEANPSMYNSSQDFWKDKSTQQKLVLLNGSLHNKIVDIETLKNIYGDSIPCYYEHYLPEKYLVENSPIISIAQLENIDFILLDGGEYTTLGDYEILMSKKPKYVAMDDVNVYKCRDLRQTFLSDSAWELYAEDLTDRNGWSIFRKRM